MPPFFYSLLAIRHLLSIRYSPLSQPSRRMREQGVDQPGLGGEVAAQRSGAAVVAGDLVEQALELGDVAVDRLLEVTVGAIFAGDFIERLLAGRRIEPLGEGLALAALIAIPHLDREIAIHQPSDIERQRFQRIAADAGGLRRTPRAAVRRSPPASARFNRPDSQPSLPPSELAGLTGGASVRREAGMPRSGGGKLEALSRIRGGAERACCSLRPPTVASTGSSSRCTLERLVLPTTSRPRP